MQTVLKEEAASLIAQMPESKVRAVVQFARFMYEQPDEAAARKARDERDIAIINARSAELNANAEETLDFQADWSAARNFAHLRCARCECNMTRHSERSEESLYKRCFVSLNMTPSVRNSNAARLSRLG